MALFNLFLNKILGHQILADWIVFSTPCISMTIIVITAYDRNNNKYRSYMEVLIPYYTMLILLEHETFIDIKGFKSPEIWTMAIMCLYFQVVLYSVIYQIPLIKQTIIIIISFGSLVYNMETNLDHSDEIDKYIYMMVGLTSVSIIPYSWFVRHLKETSFADLVSSNR